MTSILSQYAVANTRGLGFRLGLVFRLGLSICLRLVKDKEEVYVLILEGLCPLCDSLVWRCLTTWLKF